MTWARVLALVGLTWLAAGCGSRDQGPSLYPVQGKVFYRGQPARNADVFFHPVDDPDPKLPRPHGKVNARGEFRLGTRRANDGAPAGEYVVTVFWAIADKVEEPPDRLQGRYRDPKKSKLRVVIKPETNEVGPFQLE